MRKSEADTSQIILPLNFSKSAPNLTSSSNTCTLTTVSTAAGAVSWKRLSDEELVILPAILDFLARIWAQHRSRVVQASLCPVSSSGFPPYSVYQPSCGVEVDVTVRNNKRYPRACVGCIPVLIPSSDSLCNTVYCDVSRHRGGQCLSSGQCSLASSPPCLLVAEQLTRIFHVPTIGIKVLDTRLAAK
ncbi:hypothetical protein Acr_10g0005230 [Actinidia rufa]|uniref:Uncharacterized protein n=1 Tax=Actinidia rufa TaxID=165716 RepID=A0A7J0F8U7_9ERIC|nr:hypothetical protein Acr_10g0005230 [Actinidia rufa]